jgi:ABC-type glycerol-3-phosphate transport system permease component
MLWRLAFPLTRPAMVTVAVYTGVTVWNGFLLPLILTQSPDRRTMPLHPQAPDEQLPLAAFIQEPGAIQRPPPSSRV